MIANCLTVVNVNTLQRVVKWGETVVGNTICTRVIAYWDSQYTQHIYYQEIQFCNILVQAWLSNLMNLMKAAPL